MEVKKTHTLLLIFAGVFVAFSVLNAYFLLSWICYIPLFYVLNHKSELSFFKSGFCFGIGVSIVSFFWMFKGANEFSGNAWIYGTLITSISSLVFSLYWAVLIRFLGILISKCKSNQYLIAFCAASSFVIFESVLNYIFNKAPYYMYNSGYGLLDNVYSIQWASYFGLGFLSFVVIFINYAFAVILIEKRWKRMAYPVSFIILFLIIGKFFFSHFNSVEEKTSKTIKVAILAENIPPHLKWGEESGNILAERLLNLNKTATLLNPDIALWSESVIPWTYRKDDDLVNEILTISKNKDIIHIIGINSDYSKKLLYNSVYGIAPDGKVLGRYDKRFLLDFIETPLSGLSVPFLAMNGSFIKSGDKKSPIPTPYGKAGIIICNEAVIPEASIAMVKNGAEFLFNPSNDSWFRDGYIVNLHFLYARLSAVINRRDMVMNSNNGISGLIKASGQIALKKKSDMPFVEVVNVDSRHFKNEFYSPLLIIYLSLLMIASGLVYFFFPFTKLKS